MPKNGSGSLFMKEDRPWSACKYGVENDGGGTAAFCTPGGSNVDPGGGAKPPKAALGSNADPTSCREEGPGLTGRWSSEEPGSAANGNL